MSEFLRLGYSDQNVAFWIPVAIIAPSIIDLVWSPGHARGSQTTVKVRSKLRVIYLDVVRHQIHV